MFCHLLGDRMHHAACYLSCRAALLNGFSGSVLAARNHQTAVCPCLLGSDFRTASHCHSRQYLTDQRLLTIIGLNEFRMFRVETANPVVTYSVRSRSNRLPSSVHQRTSNPVFCIPLARNPNPRRTPYLRFLNEAPVSHGAIMRVHRLTVSHTGGVM